MKGLLAALAAAAACHTAAAADDVVLVRVPAAVAWSGVPDAAGEGSTAPMLYPAPTPILGLAALLTHAALVGGSRSADDRRRQEEADRALAPYRSALADWTPRALFAATVDDAGGPALRVVDGDAAGPVVESTPAFALFSDRSRLLLENRVRLPDGAAATPSEIVVRVLSNPRTEAAAFPDDDGGALLRHESALLLAHSIRVALQARRLDAAGEAVPFRTHRYVDGARVGMERGQLVGRGCGRIVIRTLRGELLSVPVDAAADAAPECGAQPYRWPAGAG